MTHSNASSSYLTPAQAAATIISLINCRPQSPRQDEIETIIARAVPAGGGGFLEPHVHDAPLASAIRETISPGGG